MYKLFLDQYFAMEKKKNRDLWVALLVFGLVILVLALIQIVFKL